MNKNRLLHWVALGFGAGLSPIMPGTAGTLVAVPLYLALSFLPLWAYVLCVIVGFGFGVWLCGYTARALGVDDDPRIVWDEITGFWIAMTAIVPTVWNVLFVFCLFRLFDIWKPWPIRWCDRAIHGGLGIMLDDVLAGIAASAVFWCVYTIFRI